jgi:hypothetical protein
MAAWLVVRSSNSTTTATDNVFARAFAFGRIQRDQAGMVSPITPPRNGSRLGMDIERSCAPRKKHAANSSGEVKSSARRFEFDAVVRTVIEHQRLQ